MGRIAWATSLEGEVRCIMKGQELSRHHEYKEVIIESDSAVAINLIKQGVCSRAQLQSSCGGYLLLNAKA